MSPVPARRRFNRRQPPVIAAALTLVLGVLIVSPALADSLPWTSSSLAGASLAETETSSAPAELDLGATFIAGRGVRQGIDVSHWQGRIRWDAVARAGIDFAIAKATEGRRFVDGWYRRNARHARANGVRFTAYHFARPSRDRHDARREADFFLRQARLTPGDLVPALDLERAGHLTRPQMRAWVMTWLHRVEKRLGVKPMIYTNAPFWRGRLGNTRAIARAGYRVLWVAHWDTHRPTLPARRWNGAGWTFWQWTDCGHVPGIGTCVDRNTFIGPKLKHLVIRNARRASAS